MILDPGAYDQQPIEVASMADAWLWRACSPRITGGGGHRAEAVPCPEGVSDTTHGFLAARCVRIADSEMHPQRPARIAVRMFPIGPSSAANAASRRCGSYMATGGQNPMSADTSLREQVRCCRAKRPPVRRVSAAGQF